MYHYHILIIMYIQQSVSFLFPPNQLLWSDKSPHGFCLKVLDTNLGGFTTNPRHDLSWTGIFTYTYTTLIPGEKPPQLIGQYASPMDVACGNHSHPLGISRQVFGWET